MGTYMGTWSIGEVQQLSMLIRSFLTCTFRASCYSKPVMGTHMGTWCIGEVQQLLMLIRFFNVHIQSKL